jgi:hypothetical protein
MSARYRGLTPAANVFRRFAAGLSSRLEASASALRRCWCGRKAVELLE